MKVEISPEEAKLLRDGIYSVQVDLEYMLKAAKIDGTNTKPIDALQSSYRALLKKLNKIS